MTRAPRFLAQLALLPLLALLASADDRAFQLVVAVSIIIVWPLTVAVAVVLVWIARSAQRSGRDVPHSLTEAADTMATVALISTGVAGAGVVAVVRIILPQLAPPGRPALVLLGWACALVGVPALGYLRTLTRVWLPMLGERPR